MRREQFIAFGAAACFAMLAALGAKQWVVDQSREQADRFLRAERQPTIGLTTIVTAGEELRFGTVLSRDNLVEVSWPQDAAPKGAFHSVDELLSGGDRATLSVIAPGEPVLTGKITGPGQRASLSALLRPGMRAVSVRVNDVVGVAGFIMPGDRVDVMMTRDISKPGGEADERSVFNDVVLQGIRVLAIDQFADDKEAKPQIVKTVTFEVGLADAQKLTLAASVGNLTLALNEPVPHELERKADRVTVADLTVEKPVTTSGSIEAGSVGGTENLKPFVAVEANPAAKRQVTVTVIRADEGKEYQVLRR